MFGMHNTCRKISFYLFSSSTFAHELRLPASRPVNPTTMRGTLIMLLASLHLRQPLTGRPTMRTARSSSRSSRLFLSSLGTLTYSSIIRTTFAISYGYAYLRHLLSPPQTRFADSRLLQSRLPSLTLSCTSASRSGHSPAAHSTNNRIFTLV